MKTINIGKLTVTAVAALLGSFLFVGCASSSYQSEEQPGLETTIDPHQAGPNTFPQYNHDMIFGYPNQSGYTVETVE